MSFNIVRNNHPEAAELFQLLSFLNPDGIIIDFLRDGAQVLQDDLRQVVSNQIEMSTALIAWVWELSFDCKAFLA